MIYTVGPKLQYSRALAAVPPRNVKLGKNGDYPGGMVFETTAHAYTFLEDRGLTGTHRVFGLVGAVWLINTEPVDDRPFHRLLTDALLVELPR